MWLWGHSGLPLSKEHGEADITPETSHTPTRARAAAVDSTSATTPTAACCSGDHCHQHMPTPPDPQPITPDASDDEDESAGRRLDSPPPPVPVPNADVARACKSLFTVEFPRPSDQYEVAKRLPVIFEVPGMTEVVRKARRVREPRPKANPRPRVKGPPVPDIRKAIDLAGKKPEDVASEMGVSVEQLEAMINRRDPSVSQWAPVLAKCTRLARVGLLKLVSRECPCGCESAGHHIFLKLKKAGESTLSKCRDHLTEGWDGWKEYRLTDALVNKFFAGQSKEAERVADVLFRLANATDKTNIFCIFVE
eukprot:m.161542 g.161542  ORF g.161542 m.161542 type:complete len:308 (-) comp12087_c0_seq1:492-1415(-)